MGVAVALTALAVPASSSVQIVGGERASTTTYPYVVYLTNPDGFQFCGGTLVTPDKVITAAHCAKGQDPDNVFVVAGRDDKQATKNGMSVPVSAIWVHPKF